MKLNRTVCQLHGGDIGVSSRNGEGSTFGFYFRVRRTSENHKESRPPFSARSSESSSVPQRSQTPRPPFSRGNSNLNRIKELEDKQGTTRNHNKDGEKDVEQNQRQQKPEDERPRIKTLTSNTGIDIDNQGMNESLRNPPTEYHPEAHPQATRDERYKETERVANKVQEQSSPGNEGIEKQLPNLAQGETKRQQSLSWEKSQSDSQEPSDARSTLLLVEDNLINQKVLKRQLQGKGFEVSSNPRS